MSLRHHPCFVFFAALFGEGPPERRDRLRKLLSELGKNEKKKNINFVHHDCMHAKVYSVFLFSH